MRISDWSSDVCSSDLGLLDRAISLGVDLCRRTGTRGIWLLLSMIGGVSCFLNSTPIVVLGAPVVRDVALALKQSPKRYLMPLAYITVLTGCCTLIGTSTNLLVDVSSEERRVGKECGSPGRSRW